MAETAPIAETVSEHFAGFLAGLKLSDIPDAARDVAIRDLIDAAGLCLAARRTDYIGQILDACDSDGPCTALGHARALDAAGAALVNGVAIHGEDFDDTLEGAPIRVGAMVIPAVLAAAERHGLSGERTLLGIVAGLESVCRINHVAAGHMHKAGFHPVGIIGALGAAAGTAVALGLDRDRIAAAFGVAASMSSGIIEYLTDGAHTKRLHPGWAAQSGYRAAMIARTGFFAPRTVFEGGHNFFKAFAPTATPDYSHLRKGLGEDWYFRRIVFKPYACGTMIHPYIDCARRLGAEGIPADEIEDILCKTGEGLVHRLWEPLAAKHRPPSGYAAKFSMPFCMALGFHEGDAGLAQFDDAKVLDPKLLSLAGKIRYEIDPENPYPRNYIGHMRVTLKSGRVLEYFQPHMRGGQHEPLPEAEILAKFRSNAAHGGWDAGRAERLLDFCQTLADRPDLSAMTDFRH
ncbi:MmgE/PrpD family protein [Halovulum dunhuangense]|uniref:MmgE/PrpD family protein n=1 Tax=Halovulum dunhuangense TaxID=1505036 RepID=A0A849L1R5_9RHOB|nr:MmgE/PrpD family protein [Halovulum dunhuangense]NNU80177.1 MmgE/PrpD family protein [Halovulum dunhuangense]